MPPLLAAFLADGSGTHAYQAFKLQYYDANAAHQGEEDGAENRKNQDERVVRLEMPIALADIVESLLKLARYQVAILARVAIVVIDLIVALPIALSAGRARTGYVGPVGAREHSRQILLVLLMHYQVPVLRSEGDMRLIIESTSLGEIEDRLKEQSIQVDVLPSRL